MKRLFFGVVQKVLVVRIHGSRIHEILPDQKAQGVANVEEILRGIDPAAPDTEHVEMRLLRGQQQAQGLVMVDPGLHHLLRDIVGTFGIQGHAIHLEVKREAFLIGLLHHPQSLDTSTYPLGVQYFVITFQHHLEIIKRLFAHLVGPPQVRLVDRKAEHLVLVAFFQSKGETLHQFVVGV